MNMGCAYFFGKGMVHELGYWHGEWLLLTRYPPSMEYEIHCSIGRALVSAPRMNLIICGFDRWAIKQTRHLIDGQRKR